MRGDDRGYIVVETVGAFLLFTLLNIAILSMISIVTVQARVHAALTQACETISMYSYVLDLTGAASHIQKNSAKAEAVQGQIDAFKGSVNGLLDGIEKLEPSQIGEKGSALADQVSAGISGVISDPKAMLQYMMNYTLDQVGSAAFSTYLARPLVGRFLANGSISGDQYLKNYGVIDGLEGLDFYTFDTFDFGSSGSNDSHLLDKNGDVRLVVQYDISYHFGALLLPFDEPKLHVTQMASTKAWLGGEGEGYTE